MKPRDSGVVMRSRSSPITPSPNARDRTPHRTPPRHGRAASAPTSQAGRCRDLVAELESLVLATPRARTTGRALHAALHQSGRQAEALRAFTTYRTYLADEVGLTPPTRSHDSNSRSCSRTPRCDLPEPPHRPTGPVTGLSVRGYELRELIGSGAPATSTPPSNRPSDVRSRSRSSARRWPTTPTSSADSKQRLASWPG